MHEVKEGEFGKGLRRSESLILAGSAYLFRDTLSQRPELDASFVPPPNHRAHCRLYDGTLSLFNSWNDVPVPVPLTDSRHLCTTPTTVRSIPNHILPTIRASNGGD